VNNSIQPMIQLRSTRISEYFNLFVKEQGQEKRVPDGNLKADNPFKRFLSFLKPWVQRSSSSFSLNSLDDETPLI
jgi:hypothetical protein